ncbi:uncharacterized protein LOC124667848 [Lolium rigidum]|uniref:uncharacterized protein LOC124667848 n=1 Tax=Lolium rigidum TaxID=89674 RepID=UPI001F5D1830|nr:uncharacterized protein LOC124667848 [Lolium rigidum]
MEQSEPASPWLDLLPYHAVATFFGVRRICISADGHAWDKFAGQAVIRLFFLELNLTQKQFKGDLLESATRRRHVVQDVGERTNQELRSVRGQVAGGVCCILLTECWVGPASTRMLGWTKQHPDARLDIPAPDAS